MNPSTIERKNSLLTSKPNLERLYEFKKFPVFMGCVDEPFEKDIYADMAWDICKDTGLIQLEKLLPLDLLYLAQHNDGVGKVWQDHYAAFAHFLASFKPQSILEIGGAHDHIARNLWNELPEVKWTTVEPNPDHLKNPKITVIKGWFNNDFKLDTKIDTVVHSHVFEHMYDPFVFMEQVSNFLKPGDRHIFTFPNMVPMLERKFTNCLNFEHTVFLTEEVTDYILQKEGFKILKKEYYGSPHSIFYATEKIEKPKSFPMIKSQYVENKKLFRDYIEYHNAIVKEINEKIDSSTIPVYLFGAHIFSQTLIQFGLKTDTIISLLDNSELKNKKRLYGTKLIVESPKILKDKGKVAVILKAGIYNDEIKKDILENINSEVEFW